MSNNSIILGLLTVSLVSGCAQNKNDTSETEVDVSSESELGTEPGNYNEPDGLLGTGSGSCEYVNPFSNLNECKQYSGADWTDMSARENCASVFAGTAGVYQSGSKCRLESNSGACVVTTDPGLSYYILQEGTAELCVTLKSACESFAGGTFLATAGGVCDGDEEVPGGLLPDGGDLQAEALSAMRSSDMVTVSPECLDVACVDDLKTGGGYISFLPKSEASPVGVIFYPGGNLDARAYAAATHAFAAQRFTSFLVPMPGDLAFNATDIALDVMASHSGISKWVLVGHSLGGVVGVKFAMRHPEVLDGIALWATFMDSGDDLSELGIPATSIFGELDPMAPMESVLGDQVKLPEGTQFVNIRGGNHSHFMWHGLKEDDVESQLISQTQQTHLAADATIHLLRRVESGDTEEQDSGYEAAALRDLELGCAHVQVYVGNFSDEQLPLSRIQLNHRDDFRVFMDHSQSEASILSQENQWLAVHQYTKQSGNPADIKAPALVNGELYCKMKSQTAIADVLLGANEQAAGAQKQCGAYNAYALNWAIEELPELLREEAQRWSILVSDDLQLITGPEFMVGEGAIVTTELDSEAMVLTTQSPVYHSPQDSNFETGNLYCKVLSHERALLLAYKMAGNATSLEWQ